MAFWNAPLDDRDHAANACRAALAMTASVARLNEERAQEAAATGEPFLPLRIGIGINSGECLVGNLGSDIRFDYSAMGDAVNVASRLEGQTKTSGVPRSEEHTSELQSLMRKSYAVCRLHNIGIVH